MTSRWGVSSCRQIRGELSAPQNGAEIKGHGEPETLQEYADLAEPSAEEKTARLLISEREKLLSSNLWKNFEGEVYIIHHY